jgi:DNA ligase (NAD+)
MKKEAAQGRLNKLKEQIADLRYRYHVLNEPGVTDEVYDSLTRELRVLEAEFPDLAQSDSDINRVAGQPLDKFQKATHRVRMLSLNDVFSKTELNDWVKRVKKQLAAAGIDEQPKFFAEVKFDAWLSETYLTAGQPLDLCRNLIAPNRGTQLLKPEVRVSASHKLHLSPRVR